jgi:hypothetical protein
MEFQDFLKGYETRFLGPDDLNKYMDLQRSWNSFMGVPMTPEEKKEDEELSLVAYYDPRNKVAGVFDSNGNLVSANSGYFYKEFPHWYTYRIFQRVGETSLAGALKSFIIGCSTVHLLRDYAESMNYFTYYNKFSISHQMAWEKAHHMLHKKVTNYEFKYDFLWEHVYLPNEGCKFRNHQFFFHNNKTTPVPTVITICNLKQEYRREHLIKYTGLENSKNYLFNDDRRM